MHGIMILDEWVHSLQTPHLDGCRWSGRHRTVGKYCCSHSSMLSCNDIGQVHGGTLQFDDHFCRFFAVEENSKERKTAVLMNADLYINMYLCTGAMQEFVAFLIYSCLL